MTRQLERIDRIEDLERLYAMPGAPALRKVATRLTPLYRKWIMTSKFCVLSTVGPEGTDASPRGDEGPVVQELDPGRLAIPDWRGNNRLDSLRNIVRDGRVSLMFMVPGSNNVVRVNGTAWLTVEDELRARFGTKGRLPATVIVIDIAEIYTQCARALMRAGLWSGQDDTGALPTVGQILAEMTDGEEGGAPYDEAWDARAAKTMW
ncbi:pyridoxamine 5'-phosphate oxidase family protein [Roseobacter weihaiensis]|uniref:pyridoxamine 5'-phosphate oxidase family protein n=1 Tax=Roseobacter weihaiensis TaxID=2763262 RepID=UPI001D0B7F32|nr:pyridoxamine 5'-phosphate oxidase family protein [Roseobacter sp. H9]